MYHSVTDMFFRQNDPEDLYSLFNTHENFGASTRHQLIFRDNDVTRNVSTKFIKAPPIRRIKLLPPKERQRQLMLKKEELTNEIDNNSNSLFPKSDKKKRRNPKVNVNLTPAEKTSLFDDEVFSTNDLIDVDYGDANPNNGDRRQFEDDYGQFSLMDSLTNETYFQDSNGKNTQIIINLTHNPR